MLCEIASEFYEDFVAHDNDNNKISYTSILKLLCGMLKASILHYQKFIGGTSEIRYELNYYDSCVVNKIINAKQHTLLWDMDNIKASHADLKVNDKFAKWAELTCRSKELGYVKICRGKKHDYLRITLDYSTRGAFKVNVTDCIDALKGDSPHETNKTLKAWNDKFFLVSTNSSRLDKEKSDAFHAFAMKCMFLRTRG